MARRAIDMCSIKDCVEGRHAHTHRTSRDMARHITLHLHRRSTVRNTHLLNSHVRHLAHLPCQVKSSQVISRISHVRTPHGYVKPYATLALQSTLYRALTESTHTHALP